MLVACVGGGSSGHRTPVGNVGKVTTNPYFCRGEWHYPQKFYEYDETGLASWYGPGFDGKPKPLGEAFNMHGISAAHRTLPLPTVVKVTNLQNGKSIRLVVDDRGPFTYQGRIIDLSLGAAKLLGTYSKGLMTVRVQSIPDESLALSNYLAKHGNSRGKMKDGRTWQQVYNDEIAGNHRGDEAVGNNISSKQKKAAKINEPLKTGESKSPATIDDILNAVTPDAKTTAKAVTKFNTYINLGEAYLQKTNAQKVASSLPKEWNATIQSSLHPSGQTFYSVRIGPFSNASQILKNCQNDGYAQAIILKD